MSIISKVLCIAAGIGLGLFARISVSQHSTDPPVQIQTAQQLWVSATKFELSVSERAVAAKALADDLRIAVALQGALHDGWFQYPREDGWQQAEFFHGLATDTAPSVIEAKQDCLNQGKLRVIDMRVPLPVNAFGSRIDAENGPAFLLWGPLIADHSRLVFAVDAGSYPEVFEALGYLTKLGATRPRLRAQHVR